MLRNDSYYSMTIGVAGWSIGSVVNINRLSVGDVQCGNAPLLLVTGDIDFENDSTEEEFLIEAPDMIPVCVKGICEFWRSHNRKPVVINVTRSRRRGNGVGRR